MDQDNYTASAINFIDDSFKSIPAETEKTAENDHEDIKGRGDNAEKGVNEDIAAENVDEEQQEMLNASFGSLNISELGSEFCYSRNSFTSENLAELSAQLDDEDKKHGKSKADLIALQMDRNMDCFNLQIQLLENANDELRVNLENERAMNAEFRHKIGKNEGVLEEQGKKLVEYEKRFTEITNELSLLRNEKSEAQRKALQSATNRDEFLKKYEELNEEKDGLYVTISKLSTELEKASMELDNLSTASKLNDAEYEQKLKELTTEKEALKLDLNSKKKELSEATGRIEKHDEKMKLIEEKYKRQKDLLKKFNDQNQMIKDKYSALKGKYHELEELRKKDKRLHAYSVELMTKKALESARSPSVSAGHTIRSSSVVSIGRSSAGRTSSVSRYHKQKKQPEVIFLDDSGTNGVSTQASGLASIRKEKAKPKLVTKQQAQAD